MELRHRYFLIWIERSLFAAGAALLAIFILVFVEGKFYQLYLNRQFDHAVETLPFPVNGAQPLPAPPPGSTSSSTSIRTNALPYLGRLEIPRLNMSIMILDGIEDRTLRRGIGHIPGTALPGQSGNMGIAGHRDTFFRPLEQIQRGDAISVQTLSGTYRYVVDSLQIVDPALVGVLRDSGGSALTLVTCYPFHLIGSAPKRFIVHASLQ